MEIRISRGARACLACEQPFEHQQPTNSLVRIEENMLIREDFCGSCWESVRGQDAYSVWAGKYYDPKVAQQEPAEVFSPLRQLFYEAADGGERGDMAVAYLAAQLLRRQKVFRLIKESVDDEGYRIALFSDRIGDRFIEVGDPHLSHAELEAGRVALLERLSQLENGLTDGEEPDHAEQQDVELATERG